MAKIEEINNALDRHFEISNQRELCLKEASRIISALEQLLFDGRDCLTNDELLAIGIGIDQLDQFRTPA